MLLHKMGPGGFLMRPQPSLLLVSLIVLAATLIGCTDESVELKQKIAELEKKVEKQKKDFGEFVGRAAPPKDFSADIQRIEDQQDRISQILKTQVEPINSRLEEFRDWAQDAQKEREDVRQEIKTLGTSVGVIKKSVLADKKSVERFAKDYASTKKKLKSVRRSLESVSVGLAKVRKEALDNNTKLHAAVKKALPRVRDAAVETFKARMLSMEKQMATIATQVRGDSGAIEALKARKPDAANDGGKVVQQLLRKVNDLEEILASHKSVLLELNTKVHNMGKQYR